MVLIIKFKFSNKHPSFCDKEPNIIQGEDHEVPPSKLNIVITIATMNVTMIAPTKIHMIILLIFLLFKCFISESLIVTNEN